MENGGDLYLSLYKKDDNLVFKIRDTGIGIKESNLKRIFVPFFTTKGAFGGGNKGGTGLGLSISRSIVEMHYGKLEVESVENEGATFTVTLPIKLKTNESKEKPEQKNSLESTKTRPAKILIVDDEELIRDLISITLFDLGHTTIEAANGEKAVSLYQEHNPDLVFLDILMPVMNGIDAYLAIKKINPEAKIVFITGHAGEYLEKILVILAKNEYVYLLRKPFDFTEIAKVVNLAFSINSAQ